jgi:hypothetical protein
MLTRFSKPLPLWAVTTSRVFLGAGGVCAPPVVMVATGLRLAFRTQAGSCGPESYCLLGDIILAAVAIPAVLVAMAAFIRTSVGQDRLRGIVIFGFALIAIAGGGFMLATMRFSLSAEESRLSNFSFQFWAAWPLVVWPSIGVVVTLLLGSVSDRGGLRIIGIAWPSACVLLTIFFLTYLLPATDARVAGLHWQGVVKLPKAMGIIRDSGGRDVVVRDRDPMVYVKDGYVVALSPGDYTVVENCTIVSTNPSGATQYLPDINERIHVAVGQVTDAPNGCPPS